MNTEILRLDASELPLFIELIRVFSEVFEMENFRIPDSSHLQKLLTANDFIAFVALLDQQVIGGLTIYILNQYYSIKPLAYIYDLAVLPAFQRKGVGRQLIDAVRLYCHEHGFEEVFVQADRIDQHAVDFYRKTKPSNEEEVLHFYYLL